MDIVGLEGHCVVKVLAPCLPHLTQPPAHFCVPLPQPPAYPALSHLIRPPPHGRSRVLAAAAPPFRTSPPVHTLLHPCHLWRVCYANWPCFHSAVPRPGAAHCLYDHWHSGASHSGQQPTCGWWFRQQDHPQPSVRRPSVRGCRGYGPSGACAAGPLSGHDDGVCAVAPSVHAPIPASALQCCAAGVVARLGRKELSRLVCGAVG
jgi:hypothetical protein